MQAQSIKHALSTAALLAVFAASCAHSHQPRSIIENSAYRLAIDVGSGSLHAVLEDKRSGLRLADGPLVYRTDAAGQENPTTLFQLADPAISAERHRLIIRGTLAGLRVEHAFTLPPDKPVMDETLRLTNPMQGVVSLPDFECGFTRLLKDESGGIPADLAGDRWVAVPHRKRAEDPKERLLDFSASDMADKPGFEAHPDAVQDPHYRPSCHRYSGGWAWTHGPCALGIYKYSQEAMYGFRRFLDERGCRFPASYDPPVHWEQLYDMEGAWDHRAEQYTKAAIEREAQEGID